MARGQRRRDRRCGATEYRGKFAGNVSQRGAQSDISQSLLHGKFTFFPFVLLHFLTYQLLNFLLLFCFCKVRIFRILIKGWGRRDFYDQYDLHGQHIIVTLLVSDC